MGESGEDSDAEAVTSTAKAETAALPTAAAVGLFPVSPTRAAPAAPAPAAAFGDKADECAPSVGGWSAPPLNF